MKNVVDVNDKPLTKAVLELMGLVDNAIPDDYQGKIKAVIAGGVATYLYSGVRPSDDLDVSFNRLRIHIPNDLFVRYTDENGEEQVLAYDYSYNDTFGLMHPDYIDNAVRLNWNKLSHIELFVLSPMDLVVSKISRFQTNDIADIESIAKLRLFSSKELKEHIDIALNFFIFKQDGFVTENIKDTIAIIKKYEKIEPDYDHRENRSF